MFDLLLSGGTLVDGTGRPARRADVAIDSDRIGYVGEAGGVDAERVLDVSGMVVAPGVIDIHTHSDFTMLEARDGHSVIRQGITTEVAGNCGQSYAPITDLNEDAIAQRSLAWQPNVDVEWRSFGDYVDRVGIGNATNSYLLVGHCAIRSAVLGFDDRPATPDEVRSMARHVEKAMDEGARGLSFGLEYPPVRTAATDELRALAAVVGRRNGFLSSHMRNRDQHFEEATEEMLAVARHGNMTLQLSHLMAKPGHPDGAWERVMTSIEQARLSGVNVAADAIPFDTGPGFATAFLPAWAIEGGPTATLRRLADPGDRARLMADHDRYWRFATHDGHWDRVTLVYSTAHAEWIGHTIDSLAESLSVPPFEVMLRLFEDEGEGMSRITLNGRLFPEQHVEECLAHPLFSIGSDGWRGTRDGGQGEVALHPNCWGWVPIVLGHYVRELGVLTLEEAIWKMTGSPAERLGISGRGRVESGGYADLMVFDPLTVNSRSSYLSPAVQPEGIHHVFVNGKEALADGSLTGSLAGRVL